MYWRGVCGFAELDSDQGDPQGAICGGGSAAGSFQAILYVESGGANGPIGNIFLGNEVSFSL